MSFPKIILTIALIVLCGIGGWAAVKKLSKSSFSKKKAEEGLKQEIKPLTVAKPALEESGDLPMIDRVGALFNVEGQKLPIVETVVYQSTVPWLKGRPAWIGDYANYYATSRHFIARSLNGKADYFTQKISPGRKFNVLRKDKNIQFYLLADLSRCKMGFYYVDLDANERVLLKTYRIGVGKKAETPSGTLTPLGRFQLGDKIAVYRPGIMGIFQDRQIEMIQVFGTRWIPFLKDLTSEHTSVKGLGIHGLPWSFDKKTNRWVEARQLIGSYESDGCIRLAFEDMEELFSIIITKPTVIEIVKNFKDAHLPGLEIMSIKLANGR